MYQACHIIQGLVTLFPEWNTKTPRIYIERNLYPCQQTLPNLGGSHQSVEVLFIFALTRSTIW